MNDVTLRIGAALFLLACTAVPASAQVDLAGTWSPRYQEDFIERVPGPDLGDYTALPLTDGARLFAESWDPGRITLPEEQCRVHVSSYIYRGPTNIAFFDERDPRTRELIAIRQRISTFDQDRSIYMDGRPHPPAWAPHTWMGFSTGRWQGNMLVVTTTHIKQGWLRRNGVPESDLATLTEYFVRSGEVLTRISAINDPVYLTEPLIKSEEFVLNLQGLPQRSWLYKCKTAVEVPRPAGEVPHFLPGTNTNLAESQKRLGLSPEAANGGARLTYPAGIQPASTAKPATSRVASAVPEVPTGEVRVMHVQGQVYLLVSSDGNMVVQAGDEGVLLVDTLPASLSKAALSAIRTISDQPIHFIINTQSGDAQVGGNEALAKAGPTRPDRSPLTNGIGGNFGGTTSIMAHEALLARMSADNAPGSRPPGTWPTDTYFEDENNFFFNNEGVQLFHAPGANADGSTIVFFRRSDVIVAGSVFSTTSYPVFERTQGGSVNGLIDALNHIIQLAIPGNTDEGGTMVLPGQGRIGDEIDVVEYRNMVTIVRDRIQALIEQGKTLEQVRATRPTLDYDARYAAPSGPASADAFITAVYESLKPPATPAKPGSASAAPPAGSAK